MWFLYILRWDKLLCRFNPHHIPRSVIGACFFSFWIPGVRLSSHWYVTTIWIQGTKVANWNYRPEEVTTKSGTTQEEIVRLPVKYDNSCYISPQSKKTQGMTGAGKPALHWVGGFGTLFYPEISSIVIIKNIIIIIYEKYTICSFGFWFIVFLIQLLGLRVAVLPFIIFIPVDLYIINIAYFLSLILGYGHIGELPGWKIIIWAISLVIRYLLFFRFTLG